MPDTIPFAAENALDLLGGLPVEDRRRALALALLDLAHVAGRSVHDVAGDLADDATALDAARPVACRTCDDTRVVVEVEPGGDGTYRHTYPCPACEARDTAARDEAVDRAAEALSARYGRAAVSRPDEDGTVVVQGMADDVEMGDPVRVRFDGVTDPPLPDRAGSDLDDDRGAR